MIKKYICELLEESLIPNKKGLFGLTVLYKICGAYSLRSRVTSAKVAGAAGASPPKLSGGQPAEAQRRRVTYSHCCRFVFCPFI